ncbi:GntR family transcriptional regulator/MocR family aminotransferase [Achromobacter deleyi]|uniref:MocR-like pyridoxine biosynthesis transcription factor PdxR n=1 Tax=Achromobacter deleyi TaxID=1353891 RepID=UPI00285739FC|nr:PLP-dependent aminotransferase family protein [Achromobacter deleyi]MDR6600107.1 GntR family transcriptional regulator/MocR family aminotransferase [Achromobacter deleyi]
MESSLDLPQESPRDGESKQSWVYRQIQERILKGALASGARLPSTRSLSQRWRVSRSTVEAAYDQLRGEGYTTGAVGSGTYVSAIIPDNFFRRGLPGDAGGHAASESGRPARPVRADTSQATPGPEPLFAARTADASLFPMATWRKGLMTSAQRVTPDQLANEESQGWLPLREQIARYLGTARGISCHADQVVILTGIRDGLDLSARILLSRQDKVLVEDPGYLNAMPLFSQFTSRVVPIAIDEHGFSVARARRHRGVKLVHVTPAHQSPTGVTMPVSRRLELLAWAKQADCWIIEDDYDSEFNYDSAPLAALKSLDTADRVIHCGSFNKTMFNALRIGYAVVPKRWVSAFSRARHTTGRSNSMIEQMTLAGFLEDGSFARHVRKARAVYAQRRDLVMRLLAQAAGGEPVRTSGEHAGFHLLWWLPPGQDAHALRDRARARGLALQPVADYCRRVDLPAGLVIGYSGLDEPEIMRQGALLQALLARPTAG